MSPFKLLSLSLFIVGWLLHNAAAEPSYLPLSVGNQWQLHSTADSTDMVFEVVGQSSNAYQVRWHNPWLPHVEFYFRPSGTQVLLTALDLGGGVWDLPAEALYFNFDATIKQTWSNLLGTFTMVSRNLSVSTPVGTYSNCLHIHLLTPEGIVFDWLLAPEVGFVQFGLGPDAYVLTSSPRAPVPRGERILGLDVNMAGDNDYLRAIALTKSTGVQTVSLTLPWDAIETAPGTYDVNQLALVNLFYPAEGLTLNLYLITMDPIGKHVPADLTNLAMNDPRVIQRFTDFLTYVFSQLPDTQLHFLALGGEIDLGLGSDMLLWDQYEAFVKAASDYARSRKPQLTVGVSATFSGLTGPMQPQLSRMNPNGILASYYPLKTNGDVHEPTVVGDDFRTLVALYPGQPIYIEQLGYPSSATLGSSYAKQSAFIQEVFKQWDVYASQIKSVTFSWLTDLPWSSVEELSIYYNCYDTKFQEFLRTLGLREYAGTGMDKPAFVTLKTEAKVRGW